MTGPQGAGMMGPQVTSLLIGLAVAAALMVVRNRRPRPLRLDRLWLRPLVACAMVAIALYQTPPPLTVLSIGAIALALALGFGMGWQRGRFMQIEVDPVSHAVTARMSSIGTVFVLVLFAGRMVLGTSLIQSNAAAQDVTVAADALLILAGTMMIAQQVEISLRARRLLAQARAGA